MLKRLAFAALLAALTLGLFAPALADSSGDIDVHALWRTRWRVPPRIFRRTDVSDWKIIVPEATENMVLNPSGETTSNYAALGGGTVTRSTTYSKWGVYSYRVQTAADSDGMSLTLDALENASHYATAFVRGSLPTAWDWSLDDTTYTAPTLMYEIDSNWSIYGVGFPAAQANGSTTLYIRQNGGGTSGDFYMDGVQVEEKADWWTTYVDGDQEGCEWNGAEHASTSSRSAQSRAGGWVRDLKDDYNFGVSEFLGTGSAPLTLSVDEYALLPGGELNAEKTHARTFTLMGTLKGTSATCDIHAARQALVEELAHDRYPKDVSGWQPIRLWFTGATVIKEIKAHYVTGLEASIKLENRIHEKLPIRFVAPDPFWYEIGESSDTLDEEDSLTFRIVARRNRDTGQWDDMGPPDAAGTYATTADIVEGQDSTIYIAGDFTNFDNIADADYIVQYNPETGAYGALNATPLNGVVNALAVGPDGTIYLGGNFTNAGGDADADYFCQYNPSTGVFSSINATPLNDQVFIITVGADGTTYIGGIFTNAGGDADADYACQIDASTGAYSALNATPLNLTVYALAVDIPNQILYIGGNFTNAGGDADADYVCQYDISAGGAYTSLSGTALNNQVYALALSKTGLLYIGGIFTNAGGDANADRICRYNGTTFTALGTGANGSIRHIAISKDGAVHVVGAFTEIGGVVGADKIARWNGEVWTYLDIDLPGSPVPDIVYLCNYDPVVSKNYDIYVGFDTTGSGDLAGDTIITNPGTAHFYPTIKITASGGSDRVLYSLRNETIGKELLFNYTLLDGETLTIYLKPPNRRIISSFFGPRPDAILANSDFAQFSIQPGDNIVTCFVD